MPARKTAHAPRTVIHDLRSHRLRARQLNADLLHKLECVRALAIETKSVVVEWEDGYRVTSAYHYVATTEVAVWVAFPTGYAYARAEDVSAHCHIPRVVLGADKVTNSPVRASAWDEWSEMCVSRVAIAALGLPLTAIAPAAAYRRIQDGAAWRAAGISPAIAKALVEAKLTPTCAETVASLRAAPRSAVALARAARAACRAQPPSGL